MRATNRAAMFVSASALLFAGQTAVFGQNNARYSIAGVQAAMGKRAALEQKPYFAQLGNLRLNLAASLGVEYNDNVNLADRNGQQDFIFRPAVRLESFLPITSLNSFNFNIEVSPAIYAQHSEYDRVLISPGSELGFDFYVGDFLFNLHDRFSYEQDPVSAGGVSGSAVYGGFNNTAGVQALWDLNKIVLVAGYDHATFLSSSTTFEYLNRNSDALNLRANFLLNESVTAGLYAGATRSYYDQNILNDHDAIQAGVDGSLMVSPNLRVSGGAGWISYLFQNTSIAGPTKDQTGFSVYLEANHTVNRVLSYALKAERSLQMGVGSELLELTSIQVQGNLKLIRELSLEPRAFYENGRELGTGAAEKYDRFGLGAALGWQLTQKLRTRLQYSFTLKDSNLPARDYQQNSILLELQYRF